MKIYRKTSKLSLKVGIITTALFSFFGFLIIYINIEEPEGYIGIIFGTFWMLLFAVLCTFFVIQLKNYDKRTNKSDALEEFTISEDDE